MTLMGWVHRRRDHGGLIFIDLRDRTGLSQCVFNPAVDASAHAAAQTLRAEFVVVVAGDVAAQLRELGITVVSGGAGPSGPEPTR